MTQRTISEQVFDKLPTFHIKILLGDFNAKLGREDNFKLPIGKETFPPPSHKAMLASVFHTAVLEVAVLVEKRTFCILYLTYK